MKEINITCGKISLVAQLLDTPTADAIYQQLPMESIARTWGDEVYFEIPVEVSLESNAKEVIDSGEIAYWVEGSCIAIGFGPTPISEGDEIRLAAKTNIWAVTSDDVSKLSAVAAGDKVLLEALQ